MRAALDNLSVIEHENIVGAADGFEAMGNHEDGLFARQRFDCGSKLLLAFGVNVGGGLVENDDGVSFMIALAMEIRCFSPPERLAPPSPPTVS